MKPQLKYEDAPEIEVKELDNEPPVQDSATEIVKFFETSSSVRCFAFK